MKYKLAIIACLSFLLFASPAAAEEVQAPDSSQAAPIDAAEDATEQTVPESAPAAETPDETPAPEPSDPSPSATSTPSQTPEPAPAIEPSPQPESEAPVLNQAPLSEEAPQPAAPQPPPLPPGVAPVVPFESRDGRAFDPVVAPSKIRLKILDPGGNVPLSPVFVSFIGVAGRTYGGQVNREGIIEAVAPTGRYYTDVLIIDTKLGPPNDPPSFFLEANEDRDLGTVFLTDQSSFQDQALQSEVAGALEQKSGLAKIFSLIVKLLLAILQEIRSLRSELAAR